MRRLVVGRRWPRGGRSVRWVIACAVAAALGAQGVTAQEEIFERGNQLYQEGDWAAAAEAYEAVLEAGFVAPDLHYNLGNAYFKAGQLGRAILSWERARALAPNDADVLANLELARTLTTDVVEPLPTFWLVSVAAWWRDLLPRPVLVLAVAVGWLLVGGGLVARILARGGRSRRRGGLAAIAGAAVVLTLGATLAARELRLGRAERGVILAEAVPVRSAPAEDDNLTLFEVHEGTRVRVDDRAGSWAEIVLDDGKVGWVPADVMGMVEP